MASINDMSRQQAEETAEACCRDPLVKFHVDLLDLLAEPEDALSAHTMIILHMALGALREDILAASRETGR
jgi:hypothetical protein